jgi:DNA-binding transcriptional LysR family regulator
MDANWDLYRSFLAVLRTGSLSGGARSLGLTQPTMGRHIQELEMSLGSLFVRSQSGLLPTDLASRLRPRAEALESEIAALTREASQEGSQVSGVVRVTAGETMSSEWLPAIFESVQKIHPKLKIELVVSNRIENLLKREADIAVRLIEPVQKSLLSKKVGDLRVGLHAHQNYLKKRGTPKGLEDLENHALIGYETNSEFIRAITKKMGPFPDWKKFTYRTDSDLAQLAMIRAGCGIGFCQIQIASREKGLVRVLPKTTDFKIGVWLVMHEDLKSRPAAYALFKAMGAKLIQGLV